MKLIIFVCIFVYSQAANLAVVEYQPINKLDQPNGPVRVLSNIIEYLKEIVLLQTQNNLDLIVFPEATLEDNPENSFEIKLGTTCTYSEEPLDAISCLAQSYQSYIIINLIEKSECNSTNSGDNCKNFGYNFYNTDVVFDRNGTIIAKYRKYNLFGEYDLDQPVNPDIVTFESDFGLKFGIFTCFDILFKSPAQDLLSESIDGVIFPSMWFSELPFLTSLQTQQMWAHEHDILLLAAGANNPFVGSGGSGIYLGNKGAYLNGIIAEGGTHAFIYQNKTFEVIEDVDILAKQMDGFFLKRDHSVDDYTAVILDTSRNNVSETLCYKDKICCNFNLEFSTKSKTSNKFSYVYQLVAFSGVRSYDGVYNGGIEICGVIACLNSSLSSCGLRFDDYDNVEWPVTFEKILITADFENSDNKTQFPNSLLSSIKPIDVTKTVWEKSEKTENGTKLIQRSWSISEKQDRLLTFAIFGRDFGWDYPPEDGDNRDTNLGTQNRVDFLIISIVCLFFILKQAQSTLM